MFGAAQWLVFDRTLSSSFLHAALSMARCVLQPEGGGSGGVGDWLPRTPPEGSTRRGDPRILFVVRREVRQPEETE